MQPKNKKILVCGATGTIGQGLAFALARYIRHILYGVAPWDLTTMLGVPLVLCAVAAVAALRRVRDAEEQEPERFAEFNGRIDAASERLVELRARVAAASRRQAAQLEDLAVAELAARQRRVTAYLSQARYALAASYDRAALAEAQP